MKINARTQYAIILMLNLAQSYSGQAVASLKSISDKEKIPQKFMEQIVAELKAKGLILAIRGANGGYKLSKDPAQISVKDIFEAVQGLIESPVPNSQNPAESSAQMILTGLWKGLSQRVHDYLASQSLSDLLVQFQNQQKISLFHI